MIDKGYKEFSCFCPACGGSSNLLKKKSNFLEYFCRECTIEFRITNKKLTNVFNVSPTGERILIDIGIKRTE